MRTSWIVVLGLAAAGAVAFAACGGKGSATSSSSGGTRGTGGDRANGSSGASTSGDAGGSSGAASSPGTLHAGCRIFPIDNAWNAVIAGEALDNELMASVMPGMALGTGMHPDWGTTANNYGIPVTVGKAAPPAPIAWNTTYGPRESDRLPCSGGDFCYPIPLDVKIEGGPGAKSSADRHALFLANDGAPDHCVLYELYNTQNPSGAGFTAASGAIWKLDSNNLRTEGWTSADAAGLSVLPGLVRWEEVQRGEITHAIRFTMDRSRQAYIHPATHAAGLADPSLPPMGLRLRLKASFDDSAFAGPSKIIAIAMKKYGIILADNGSDWYISGETHDAWGPEMDALLTNLRKVRGSDFEIVKTGAVVIPSGN